MSSFFNPYQFIPVTGKINGDKDSHRVDYADIGAGEDKPCPTVRHDLWHKNGLSGRIVCSLHLDTPTLVGAGQTPDQRGGASLVEQYHWRGQPAIPASSLKGMTASIAEALSQSALRILGNGPLSLRIPDATSRVGTRREPLYLTEHDYFRHIDPELVPWSKDREALTPAEVLFGAVEVNEKGANPDDGRNLAGRLRFHDALPAQLPVRCLPEVMLRILDSPKLPCPSLYFHLSDNRGGWISKDDLYRKQSNTDILPNGRKFFLHHPQAQIDAEAWRTADTKARPKNKLRGQPMAAGQTFHFHVDFDNLTRAELTLLECALAPGIGFRHRLGLGKPLGLGSVTVEVDGVFLIDRARRYGLDALEAPERRYHAFWRPEHTPRLAASTGHPSTRSDGRYAAEWRALQGQEPPLKPDDQKDPTLIDRDTLAILLTLGDPAYLAEGAEVHTPLTEAQRHANAYEHESFRWFVENDKTGHQALRPVEPGQPLPPLFANPNDARGHVFVPEIAAVAPPRVAGDVDRWLETHVPSEGQYRTRPTAETVVKIDDHELRARVFMHICRHCASKGIYLDNSADRFYRKHGLVPSYE